MRRLRGAAVFSVGLTTACGSSATTTVAAANFADGSAYGSADGSAYGSADSSPYGSADGSGDDAAPTTWGDAAEDAGATACTGKPGTWKGKTDRTVTVSGVSRTYVLYEPPGIDPDQPVPLVLVFHGMSMSGEEMFDITEYPALADSEHFVVAFPDGEPFSLFPWNVGPTPSLLCPPGNLVDATGNDLGFTDALIADIGSDSCIDRRHIFVVGFSMGGFFAHDVGCVRPDIAAIGAASAGTYPFTSCATGHKPVIMFHGTADNTVSHTCDDTARTQWVQKNGCSSSVTTTKVKGGHCEWSQGCPKDGQVVYCLFDGMGHAWAGGAADAGLYDSLSSAPDYESATRLSWNFFKQYAFN
jgi:polyhydroxybutyrate depolymerase